MEQQRQYAKIFITEKSERSIRAGHPWVYGAEITRREGACQNGGLVDVLSSKGRYLGTGFINGHSKIQVRLISRNANDRFDTAFWERRLRHAIAYRKTVMGADFDCCRLIFGEADFFPGLTVDRFHNLLVTQTLSLGIEQRKDLLFPLLLRILREEGETIDAIYERNDVAIRTLEGLEQGAGFYPPVAPCTDFPSRIKIVENGLSYWVDYQNGQKTGYFLDQKYNRQAVARLAAGRHVLDCFTHTGAFALNAANGGAASVHAVDISADAIRAAAGNAQLNGLENRISFETVNVFDLLPKLVEAGGHPYDFIIVDPPAFTKNPATVKSALRGYKEINLRAMRLLPRGGYLATCSCSHFMTEELFCKMLRDAAADAAVSLRQIEARQQSPDHPILWNVPETNYLKFYLFQVV